MVGQFIFLYVRTDTVLLSVISANAKNTQMCLAQLIGVGVTVSEI